MMERPPDRHRLPLVVDTAAFIYAATLVVTANGFFMRPGAALLQPGEEAHALAFARRMLDGGRNLPYVDAVGHLPPLFYWIVAAATKVFGFGSWTPMRALALASMLATVALWFGAAWVARHSLAGAVAALGYVSVCVVGLHRPWEGPAGAGLAFSAEQLVNVFTGAALLCMAAAFPVDRARPRWTCVGLSGACVTSAALSQQAALFAVAPFALWTISEAAGRTHLSRRSRAAVALWFGGGLLVPLACVVVRYASAGQLRALFYYAITYDARIYLPGVKVTSGASYAHFLFGRHRFMLSVLACLAGWGLSRLFARAAAASPRVGALGVEDVARAYSAVAFEVTLALGALAALAGATVVSRDVARHYLPILPWVGLLAGLVLDRATRGAGKEARDPRRVAIAHAALLIPLALVATLGWRRRAVEYANDLDVAGAFHTHDWPICKLIGKLTEPSDSIFIWGADPAPYTACDRRPASRFVSAAFVSGVIDPQSGGEDTTRAVEAQRIVPGAQELLIDDLEQSQPKLVIDSLQTLNERSMLDYYRLRSFLTSGYCRDVADGPDVWVRRPAGGCAARVRPLVSLRRARDGAEREGAPGGGGWERLTLANVAGIEAALAAGYEKVGGQEGYVFESPQPGTTALELYADARGHHRLTTTNPVTDSDPDGPTYARVRVEGYVFQWPHGGTIPLKLLCDATDDDCLTTTSPDEEAAALRTGHRFVRTEGYVTRE